jgi:hypothetical protein
MTTQDDLGPAAEQAVFEAITEFSVAHPDIDTKALLFALLHQAVKMSYFTVGFDREAAKVMLHDLTDMLVDSVDNGVMKQFGTSKNVSDFVEATINGMSTKN